LSDICSVCPIKASASCSGVVTGEREGGGEREGVVGKDGGTRVPLVSEKNRDIKYNGCGKIGYKGKNFDDQNRIFFCRS
jgi:hypothetical protein